MKDKWLNDLRDRMSGFEMDAPDDLWASIEEAEMRRSSARRQIPWMLWLKRASAVAAACVIAILAIHYRDSLTAELSSNVGDGRVSMIPEEDAPLASPTEFQPAYALADVADVPEPIMSATRHREVLPDSESPAVKDVECVDPSEDINGCDGREDDALVSTCQSGAGPDYPDMANGNPARGQLIASSRRDVSRLSFGIYSSGGTGSDFSQRGMGDDIVSAGYDDTGWADRPMLGILLYNQGKEIETHIRHRQPVRAGLSFTYKLTDRIGIGTGLSYTNLTSDLTSGSDSHYFKGEQTLHYLGIPVNVTYDIFRWKRFQLYASAGVLGEKCVSATRTTGYVIDKSSTSVERQPFDRKPFQFSINASAGVQFNLIDAIGIYAEPGVAYYFNDGTDIQTIYKDRPCNFNLNLGVRLTVGR